MALHIYFVNLDFPPIGGPGVWRILAMVKYAAQAGHKVTVFCSDRSSWHGRTDESLLKQIPQGVEVVRVHAWFLTDTLAWLENLADSVRPSILRRLILAFRWRLDYYWPDSVLYWATKTAIKAVWRARQDRPDCVFTTGPQHLSHLTGYLLHKLLKTVWVMDYRDPWNYPAEMENPKRIPYQHRLFTWLEGKFVNAADAVTVVSPMWLEEIRGKFSQADRVEKFHLLRNGHDLPFEAVEPVAENLTGLLERPLKIHFNGTIQSASNLLLPLLEAVKSLASKGVDPLLMQFSFCGLPTDFKAGLHGGPFTSCFVDYGPLEHNKSLECCRNADVLLVMVQSGDTSRHRGVIPGKTYEAIALGKHIFGVLPAQCDMRELLNDYPNSTLTIDTEGDSIADGIRELLKLFESSGRRIPSTPLQMRMDIARKYSRRSQAEQLIQIMRKELSALHR